MEATATCVAVGPDLHDRVWTGRRLILLGGQPAVITSTAPGYGDGAVYDPAKNRWRDIVPPKSPAGHLLAWQAGVQARGQVLAWSQWATSRRLGPNASTSRGGVELFTYGERTGRWRLVSQTPGELPAVEEVLRAGRQAVVRGLPYDCIGSFAPEETAVYDPDRNTWRRLPPDPLGGDHLVSTWTGAALFSFDSEGQYGPVRPGSASAYDLRARSWRRLPSAPFGCGPEGLPQWTGRQVLIYCPRAPLGPGPRHDGLAFTVGET